MTAANVAVVVAAAGLTSTAGLVVGDLLPKPAPTDVIVASRVIAVVIMFVILVSVLTLRGRMHRVTGTLFYLNVLDEDWEDRRQEAARTAAAQHQAFRSVSRWVDLHHRTSPEGVIEVADIAREVGVTIEDLINLDTPQTGYTVAPNMPWPLALAVGTHLPAPPGLRVAQFYDDEPVDSFPLAAPRQQLTRHDHRTIGSGGRIGVWLAFTAAAEKFTIEQFSAFGAGDVHVISAEQGPPTAQRPARRLTAAELASLPAELAEYLVTFRTEADRQQRELVVVAMIPSSVALAVGWRLARHRCRFFSGTHLMHYDQKRGLLPMRARESQPGHPPAPVAYA
ncbi:hypothetical protein [Kutzneria buriramensis]|uniref:hypothetical protein n=1 Tax=Kutzneria buriramensis TaxID=1045776 RepID=UPI000E222E70|nr:hypothetical protein [Kutzneria buriramensis]